MTNRDFLNAIIENTVTEEVIEYAKESLRKMDTRNANRSSRPSKVSIANVPLKEKIVEYLQTVEYATASMIGEVIGTSVNKASALCRQLAEDESTQVNSGEIKVPKKGKQKKYFIG